MIVLDRLYGGVVTARNALYDRQVLKPRRLHWPVVSIGNISAGGSGKTPFVIALGELLLSKGTCVDVLSRGYRRSSSGVLRVNASGTPEQFGDEPLLVARKLRCPVIVGENRFSAGEYAEREYQGAVSSPMHLLDDGFQHRQLYRDFDIVLLNHEDLDDKFLPSGRLREPLESLQRADALVVDSEFPATRIPKGKFQVWNIERQSEIPHLNAPVIAFCGIARPQQFFTALRSAGVDLREQIIFRDHHRYSAKDVERLTAIQARLPNSVLVTTEKDEVNLGILRNALNLVVIPMRIELHNAERSLRYMLGVIAERRACF